MNDCLSRKLQDATDVNIADKMAACTGPYVCEAAGAGTQSTSGATSILSQLLVESVPLNTVKLPTR